MPAHPGDINQIDFQTVWLLVGLRYTYAKSLGEFLLNHERVKLLCIRHLDRDHEIFCKGLIVVFLQNEFASIAFKPNIVAGIPADLKAQLLKELFGAFKIGPRGNEGFE